MAIPTPCPKCWSIRMGANSVGDGKACSSCRAEAVRAGLCPDCAGTGRVYETHPAPEKGKGPLGTLTCSRCIGRGR